MKFIATCVPGLESLLREELDELGVAPTASEAPPGLGAVDFGGSWPQAARVLAFSRLASRVLLELRDFASRHADMLYDQVRRVKWAEILPTGATMAVFTHGHSASDDLALSFAALKIKDAVCDEIRKSGRDRPDVDRSKPDVRLEAHFGGGRCRLSVDLSGAPLHKRGARAATGAAPIRENRAAALLRLTGLRPGAEGRFVDPFCGSGTILIEASAIAQGRAPILDRDPDDYAASRLFAEATRALSVERERAEDELRPLDLEIEGRDVESQQLEAARANLKSAGLKEAKLVRIDLRESELEADWVVTNPPHGLRIGRQDHSAEMLALLATKLKNSGRPCRLGLAVSAGPLEKAVGLRPSRRLTVENGPEKLWLMAYEVRPGSFKTRAQPQGSDA